VAQAEALVRQDEVDLQKARRDLERGRRVLAEGLLSNQQGEDLEWSAASADAKLGKARADLSAARVDLGYAIIRAPIAGTVASVSTQEGETVAASFTAPTFVTIVETDALELVAMVDEVDIGGVHPGDKVSFTVEAYPNKDLSGTVRRVNPTATIISGVVNYEVVIGFAGDIPFLKPDMTANVAVRIAEREALVVPNAAVHESGDEKFVYVLENGQTRKRLVRTGSRTASETEIQRGLTEQDRLVLGPSAEPKKDSS
ncbi:MAG TPA: efflux RND transporter periplasmic adaptor subunit, partial [Thermoanaerobaculia bacterium]